MQYVNSFTINSFRQRSFFISSRQPNSYNPKKEYISFLTFHVMTKSMFWYKESSATHIGSSGGQNWNLLLAKMW